MPVLTLRPLLSPPNADAHAVHELGFTLCSREYLLRGDAQHTHESVKRMLGLGARQDARSRTAPNAPATTSAANGSGYAHDAGTPGERFLPRLSDCDFNLDALIDHLGPDSQTVPPGHRPLRCIGAAVSAAVALAELCVPFGGCRICVLAGGAW